MKKISLGLPEELSPFEEIVKEQSLIKIYIDRRRYGKVVTIIEGFDKSVDLEDLAKILKKRVASGGTVKDGRIELQGDHREKVKEVLESMGYIVEIR